MSTTPIFDENAERYDLWYTRHRGLAASELRAVRRALGDPGTSVEIGVGSGFFASKLGVEFGLDPSLGMLRMARRRGVNVVAGVGEKPPLRPRYFDSVLIVVTICFADDPHALVREASKLLKPGGRLVTCIVPKESAWGRHYVSLGAGGHPFYSAARFLSVGEVRTMIRGAGLEVVGEVCTLGGEPGVDRLYEPRECDDGSRYGFVCIVACKKGLYDSERCSEGGVYQG